MNSGIKAERFAAVIAAAGFSSRMQDFKPLMPFGESTVIGTVIKAFQAAGVSEIVVVCGHRGEELSQYVVELGARPIINPQYAQSGMYESLLCGLSALNSSVDRCFLTPGDVPLITEELVKTMMQSDADWAVPAYGNCSGHPVLVSASLLPHLKQYAGPGGLRGALETWTGDPALIPWSDEGVLLDADTQEDYQRLRAMRENR